MKVTAAFFLLSCCIAALANAQQDPWVTSCSAELRTRYLFPLKMANVRFATFTGAVPSEITNFYARDFTESSLGAAEVPLGDGTPSCNETQPIKTSWPANSDVVVRFHVDVNFPLVVDSAVINVVVDGALVGVWLNGQPLQLTATTSECGGSPIAISIPTESLVMGDNVVAIHATSQQAQSSYLWFDVEAFICYDYCEQQSKACMFYFEGFDEHDAAVFNLTSPNGPGFTTTILSKESGRITNLNANFAPLFMDPDTSVVQPLTALGMSLMQFKVFNEPLPKVGFEQFQGDTEAATAGLCVVMRFSNWQQSGSTVNISSVDECTECCAVFRIPGGDA